MSSYVELLESENKIKLLEPFKGAKQHHKMVCLVCGHKWLATPLSKRQAYKQRGVSGCPKCNNLKKAQELKDTQQPYLDELKQRGLEIVGKYSSLWSTTTKIKFRNTICGHTFKAYPGNVISNGTVCGVCSMASKADAIVDWSKQNSKNVQSNHSDWESYKHKVVQLSNANYKKHEKQVNPNGLLRGRVNEKGSYRLSHTVPIQYCFDNGIPVEICASPDNLRLVKWDEPMGPRADIGNVIPAIFLGYLSLDTKMAKYAKMLKSIFPAGETFCVLHGIAVTMYDKEANRAIVILPIDESQSNKKTGLVARNTLMGAGIDVTILFEDEMEKPDLILSKLKHYNHIDDAPRIHARDCDIRLCSRDEKRNLLNANHIQGNDNSQISIGAYYQDSLVAVMTFAHPRIALGQKDLSRDVDGIWELSRFCTDTNYRIPGIASRLLSYFKKAYNWKEIYSYADKRWSAGNMYHKLGFMLVGDNPPDYFYVIGGKRKHRWNYRKDVLKDKLPNYDASLTEHQNMINHGFWRVWDCGTLKFSMHS